MRLTGLHSPPLHSAHVHGGADVNWRQPWRAPSSSVRSQPSASGKLLLLVPACFTGSPSSTSVHSAPVRDDASAADPADVQGMHSEGNGLANSVVPSGALDHGPDILYMSTLPPPSPPLLLPDSSLPPATPPPVPIEVKSAQRKNIMLRALPGIRAAIPEPEELPASNPKGMHKGIRPGPAIVCVAVGLVVQFLVPMPSVVNPKAWTLLAVFCSTIAGLIFEPMPVSAWCLCTTTALMITGAATFQQAMSGLQNEAIWLICFAFFFAKAFEKTGLGERIANMLVSVVGYSTLGLAYSLAAAESMMAPAMPSCTARAGGIFMPVILSMAKSQGSEPNSPSQTRLGTFLVHSQMQLSSSIAALFMTGAAQNLLAMNIAKSMGVNIPSVWTTWALGAVVPGVVSILMTPYLISKFSPPEVRETPQAPAEAKKRLLKMGPLSRQEKVTLAVLFGAVILWMTGEAIGVPAVTAAMMALSTLLATGVLSWEDCLTYAPAWDTLLWFALLMSMCSLLASSGLVAALADAVGHALSAARLPWLASFGLLHGIFFWSHYLFASQVGHVGALYGAFLAIMCAAGVPSTLAAMSLGYSANLFGSLTHYASGPAAVYHASGYTTLLEVMQLGFLMACRSWLVWGTLGMAWWKLIGWW